MNNLYTIIKSLQDAQGTNAKKAILEANKDDELLQAYLKACYDPAINYYQSKIKLYLTTPSKNLEFGLWALQDLQQCLVSRKLTGSAAIAWLAVMRSELNTEGQFLLDLIIKRSIGAGVGDTLILDVWPDLYFIPSYMRCSLLDDKAKEHFSKLPYFIVQPKLDGSFVYLVSDKGDVSAITRGGNKYPSDVASTLATGLKGDYVLAGELLVASSRTDKYLSRQEGNGILNSVLKGGELPLDHVIVMETWEGLSVEEFRKGNSKRPLHERLAALDSFVTYLATHVNVVDTHIVHSLKEAYQINQQYLALGKEGSVIKDPDSIWKDGTSKGNVKLKVEFEVDLKIVKVVEGTGKYVNMMGSVIVESSDGLLSCSVGSGFKDTDRINFWLNSEELVGRIMTVKANDIVTNRMDSSKSLFLPIFIELREDKKEADSLEKCYQQLKTIIG